MFELQGRLGLSKALEAAEQAWVLTAKGGEAADVSSLPWPQSVSKKAIMAPLPAGLCSAGGHGGRVSDVPDWG